MGFNACQDALFMSLGLNIEYNTYRIRFQDGSSCERNASTTDLDRRDADAESRGWEVENMNRQFYYLSLFFALAQRFMS